MANASGGPVGGSTGHFRALKSWPRESAIALHCSPKMSLPRSWGKTSWYGQTNLKDSNLLGDHLGNSPLHKYTHYRTLAS